MKYIKRKHVVVLSFVLVVIFSFGFIRTTDKDFAIVKSLDVFYSLFREVNMFYVDDIDPEKIIETGINSMLESLDPYTVFIPESDKDDFDFMTTGKYGGIGSLIRQSNGYTMIAEPYEGSPAALAGLRAGDIIISVDGFQTKGQNLSIVSDRLKGEPGTEVNLLVKKPGKEKNEKVKIIREQIRLNNVSYSGIIENNTGYIMLSNFTFGAGQEVKDAFLELKKEGNIDKLILDLRGNPGGLLIEAVRVCNLFIPKGELIVSTRGKIAQWDQSYTTTLDPIDDSIPLVILVNRGSASASEIVAGAMQDLDRAVVLGQRTFGKGLVQTTRKLKYDSQLKVTTAKYYIPSGRCIQALDYQHRNEDGSVGHIPDSLISEYTTKNGRKVYDGGGIIPDLVDTADFISQFALNLYVQNVIFDFVTEYIIQHPEAPEKTKFELSDEQYQAFIDFVLSKDFEYETGSEKALKDLIQKAKSEKYYDQSAAEFTALQQSLKHDNETDLKLFKTEISELINEEIQGRFYFQRGRIGYSTLHDTQVSRAVEVLKDKEGYTDFLGI